MSNFTRATHDFHDDKITIKVKSFVTEYENEVKYEEIRHIQLIKTADLRWLWFGLLVTMLPSIVRFIAFVFSLAFLNNSPFPFIGKIIIFVGVIICIPAFYKNEVYFLADQANRDIVSIKLDNKNRTSANQAVELVRQKSPIISDTSPNMALPSLPPLLSINNMNLQII
jgi:uncharacterized protein YacL